MPLRGLRGVRGVTSLSNLSVFQCSRPSLPEETDTSPGLRFLRGPPQSHRQFSVCLHRQTTPLNILHVPASLAFFKTSRARDVVRGNSKILPQIKTRRDGTKIYSQAVAIHCSAQPVCLKCRTICQVLMSTFYLWLTPASKQKYYLSNEHNLVAASQHISKTVTLLISDGRSCWFHDPCNMSLHFRNRFSLLCESRDYLGFGVINIIIFAFDRILGEGNAQYTVSYMGQA